MEADDETAVSEITILPDGRVFVLGASPQVLEILETLGPEDAALKQRLRHARGVADYESVERGDEMKISVRSTNAVSEGRHP
jgi:hypothetical protein